MLSNKYQNIFNNAIIGIIVFDNDHCIEEVNQTFADQFNINRRDIIGKKIESILPSSLNKKWINLIKKLNKGKYPLIKDVITIQKELKEHTILEISLSKFRNPNDTLDKNMMIVEDITKEKDTHEALIQSEKLALTGRLAASLAHEINNPLQASIGCLGLVDEILDEDDRKADLGIYINMALDELKRGARIVKKLRDLHRKSDPSEKTPIDLKRMIDDVLLLAKNQLYDRNIVPIFPFQGSPPIIMAVRDQIQSVLLNIVINAVDAMPNGGFIYVDLDPTEDPDGFTLKIRDTGTGMDQNVIDHLFDPFFTTKEEGVGLGLYLCNEIVNNHDGHIKVDSEVGKGTIFSIWLPKGDSPEGEV
jgi:PAS domain S-box-containing protein